MQARMILTAVLLAALQPALAHADEWHKTFNVQSQPAVHVTTNDGNVQINSWDRPQIDARVVTSGWRIGDGGVQVTAMQSGNEVDLTVKEPRNWGFSFGSRWVRVELTVPRRLTLNARTGDGNVSMSFVGGTLEVHTGDGNVEGHNLDTTSFQATTGDGNIRLDGRFAALNARSGDGNVQIEAAGGSTAAQPWSLRSGDGNITLALPADFKADLAAHTGDGSITLDIPVTTTGEVRHSDVHGQINGGGGALNLETGDGSIHLTRN